MSPNEYKEAETSNDFLALQNNACSKGFLKCNR